MGAPLRRWRWWAVAVGTAVALSVAVVVAGRDGDGGEGAGPPATTVTTPRTSPRTTASGPTTAGTPTSSPTTAPTTVPTTPPATTTPPTVAPTTAPPTTGPVAPATVVRRGDPSRNVVALTFDAGSDTGFAADILDTLAAHGVPATFGMTGTWAEANAGLVARMHAEGHQLVNHSYDHPSFTGYSTGTAPLSRSARLDQLARADAAIRAATGASTVPWFRPPYGDEDESVRADVALAGYRYELMWTVDSLGWKGIAAGAIVERCLGGAVPGAIFLFHVGAASADAEALPTIIERLRQQGYGFVTAAGLVAP